MKKSNGKSSKDKIPQLHGIEALPTIGFLIDGYVEDLVEQYETLVQARGKTGVLDNATLDRVIRVHTETQSYATVFGDQLSQWGREPLTDGQRVEVDRLAGQMPKYRELCGKVLALAAELRPYTIDTVMGMSDEHVGLVHLIELACVNLSLPRDVATTRSAGLKGEPAVKFTHEKLGLLGFVFVSMASNGGLDVNSSIADREVSPQIAKERLAVFAPLAEEFVRLLAEQVRALNV